MVDPHFGAVAVKWGGQHLYQRLGRTFAATPGARRFLLCYPSDGGWKLLSVLYREAEPSTGRYGLLSRVAGPDKRPPESN